MEPLLKYQVASPLNYWHLFQHEYHIALVGSMLCQHRGNWKMQDCNCLEDQEERLPRPGCIILSMMLEHTISFVKENT
jgi:hypothetical protein